MKSIYFIFIVFLVLPSVSALNCTNYDNKGWCHDIIDSDLSIRDKLYLLRDVDNRYPADLNYASFWKNNNKMGVIPGFTISTDKAIYDINEPIVISIKPSGRKYVVEYAEKNVETNSEITINAVFPYNKIIVSDNEGTVETLIHVKDKKPIAIMFSLSFFGILNHAMISFIKRRGGGICG